MFSGVTFYVFDAFLSSASKAGKFFKLGFKIKTGGLNWFLVESLVLFGSGTIDLCELLKYYVILDFFCILSKPGSNLDYCTIEVILADALKVLL